jgi:hypothetical protein
MIQLNEGTAGNIVALTLNENTTISAPIYYLFEFIGQDTNTAITFLATDTTWNRCRFNKFNIELVDAVDQDLTQAKINLSGGRYKYNIYQQNSSSNLVPALALGIVEKGFVDVNIPITQTVYNDQNNNNIVYGG